MLSLILLIANQSVALLSKHENLNLQRCVCVYECVHACGKYICFASPESSKGFIATFLFFKTKEKMLLSVVLRTQGLLF